ncbi:MAG: phage tail tube protein [Dorea sp.]
MRKWNLQLFAEPTLPDNTITPEMNYETEAFINTATGSASSPVWSSLAALTKNMAQSLNEVLYQATYYADKGWGSTEVTGAQMTLDAANDMQGAMNSFLAETGKSREETERYQSVLESIYTNN